MKFQVTIELEPETIALLDRLFDDRRIKHPEAADFVTVNAVIEDALRLAMSVSNHKGTPAVLNLEKFRAWCKADMGRRMQGLSIASAFVYVMEQGGDTARIEALDGTMSIPGVPLDFLHW